jgi:phosphoglycerate dehydrogenase-like enzyme
MASRVVKVLVMAPHLGADLAYIADVDPCIEVLDGNTAFRAELIEQGQASSPLPRDAPSRPERDRLMAEAQVLLMGFPILHHVTDRTPSLRWAHQTQAGVSNLFESDLWTSDVTLTSSRGVVGVAPIAEYVLAGVFHFARGLDSGVGPDRSGALERGRYHLTAVAGATIGIVGLGGIGREVARLAKAVGMRVVATRRSVSTPQRGVQGVDLLLPASRLLELAAASDYLAVCTQLTSETTKLIGKDVFASLQKGAVLINIARGEEIDEIALIDAVRSGHLRGALLDVYDGELAHRPPRQELLDLPQIVLTPHISTFGDPNGWEPVKRLFAENLRRFLRSEPLLNLIDRTRGY